MNTLDRLDELFLKGRISEDEYLEHRRAYGVKALMKTAEGIIAYLEAEMNEAIEIHDASKDTAQRFAMMLKAYTISELLDEIKA